MIAEAVLNALSILVRWIPVRAEIVYEYQQGVRWWAGHATSLLDKPGWYLYVPWIGFITKEVVKPKEVETKIQCITTGEGKARSFSVGYQYETTDLRLQQTCVDDAEDSLTNLVCRVSARVMRNSSEPDPDKAIRTQVRSQAEKWGIRIKYLGLMNDVRSRPLHHFVDYQSGDSDE